MTIEHTLHVITSDTVSGDSTGNIDSVEEITALGEYSQHNIVVSDNSILYMCLLIARVAQHYPGSLDQLSFYIGQPLLKNHICHFLYDQVYPNVDLCGMNAPIDMFPDIHTKLGIHQENSRLS